MSARDEFEAYAAEHPGNPVVTLVAFAEEYRLRLSDDGYATYLRLAIYAEEPVSVEAVTGIYQASWPRMALTTPDRAYLIEGGTVTSAVPGYLYFNLARMAMDSIPLEEYEGRHHGVYKRPKWVIRENLAPGDASKLVLVRALSPIRA